MEGFWYLWRVAPENDYVPVSIGCLRTTEASVEVVACEDEDFLRELDLLKDAEALKFREDRTLEENGQIVIATYDVVAKKGDPAWPEALIRNLMAETGVRITPTPSPY